jgi:hypothetical protein
LATRKIKQAKTARYARGILIPQIYRPCVADLPLMGGVMGGRQQ